jgi:thiol-disulfide isomerase/thioredoxin
MEYFATWCTPCRDSSAHLVRLNRKWGKQGVHVLGLSLDEDGDKAVREFIIANRINYPVALADEAMQSDYTIRSVPTLYVIDKNGYVAEKFMGYNEDIENRLHQLLLKLLSE